MGKYENERREDKERKKGRGCVYVGGGGETDRVENVRGKDGE